MKTLFIALVLTMLGFTAFAQSQLKASRPVKIQTKQVTGAAAEKLMLEMFNDLSKQDPTVTVFDSSIDTTILNRDTKTEHTECTLTGAHGGSPEAPSFNCTIDSI